VLVKENNMGCGALSQLTQKQQVMVYLTVPKRIERTYQQAISTTMTWCEQENTQGF
jgi:hypothetical protein